MVTVHFAMVAVLFAMVTPSFAMVTVLFAMVTLPFATVTVPVTMVALPFAMVALPFAMVTVIFAMVTVLIATVTVPFAMVTFVCAMMQLGELLIKKDHPAKGEISQRVDSLMAKWKELLQASNNRGKGLEEARDILEFNEQVDKVEMWIREKVRHNLTLSSEVWASLRV